MNKKELWLRLCRYHFDHLVPAHLWDLVVEKFGGRDASTKAFADKLARKLDWNRRFALFAIWEYKKFAFLGVTADFSVTPSKIIDQVWHEHLLFSHGYRQFCEEVIEYDFTHNPELIPADDQTEVFQAQYEATIALYEREFGAEPPAEIWGVTKFSDQERTAAKPVRKRQPAYVSFDGDGSDTLVTLFSGDGGSNDSSSSFDFGGGEFGGGGASGSWGDSSDSSDGSSDGGSDGGSSCSSGCGGCGGGD